MYKALVVDDEPIILEGFDNLISWEEFGIEISAKAENGKPRHNRNAMHTAMNL